MAYKRTGMLEFTRERPVLFPAEEFDLFNRQIQRYAALVEDAQEYAEDCQSWSKSCGRRSRRRPTGTFIH
jgi:hypothetical protein